VHSVGQSGIIYLKHIGKLHEDGNDGTLQILLESDGDGNRWSPMGM